MKVSSSQYSRKFGLVHISRRGFKTGLSLPDRIAYSNSFLTELQLEEKSFITNECQIYLRLDCDWIKWLAKQFYDTMIVNLSKEDNTFLSQFGLLFPDSDSLVEWIIRVIWLEILLSKSMNNKLIYTNLADVLHCPHWLVLATSYIARGYKARDNIITATPNFNLGEGYPITQNAFKDWFFQDSDKNAPLNHSEDYIRFKNQCLILTDGMKMVRFPAEPSFNHSLSSSFPLELILFTRSKVNTQQGSDTFICNTSHTHPAYIPFGMFFERIPQDNRFSTKEISYNDMHSLFNNLNEDSINKKVIKGFNLKWNELLTFINPLGIKFFYGMREYLDVFNVKRNISILLVALYSGLWNILMIEWIREGDIATITPELADKAKYRIVIDGKGKIQAFYLFIDSITLKIERNLKKIERITADNIEIESTSDPITKLFPVEGMINIVSYSALRRKFQSGITNFKRTGSPVKSIKKDQIIDRSDKSSSEGGGADKNDS